MLDISSYPVPSVGPSERKKSECRCLRCDYVSTISLPNRCPNCQGAIEVFYDVQRARVRASPNPLLRYFDLLPLNNEDEVIWLGEGNTPCIRATELGRAVGLESLFLKDETANPTRTTKDRIASLGLSCLQELGISEFVISSTGNSSTAYARGVQLVPGFRTHIFVGAGFVSRLGYTDHPRVSTYVVNGGFDAAGAAAKQFAAESGIHFEGGFFNPARREALKLTYLEAFDQMVELDAPPSFVFQAISSGMGLMGGYKGALEYLILKRLPSLPHFVAVQQSSCAPMVAAFGEGCREIERRHIVDEPSGIAEAILRGDPTQTYPYIRHLVSRSGGSILAVSEDEILEAREKVWGLEGLRICNASATAVAGAIKMTREGLIARDQPVLVNITGADRPRHPTPNRLEPWTG